MRIILIGLFVIGTCTWSYADVDPWRESYRLEGLYQYDAAIDALDSVSPENEVALLRRGWLNYLKGSHSKAIEYYQKAISKYPSSLDARLGIILPLMAQQRWREAGLHAEKVLEVAPWNYFAHLRLLEVEMALKDWRTAASHAYSVSQHYPTDVTLLLYCARSHMNLNNKNEASQAYRKVLELLPDNMEATLFVE